jgi:hypothetical protein
MPANSLHALTQREERLLHCKEIWIYEFPEKELRGNDNKTKTMVPTAMNG